MANLTDYFIPDDFATDAEIERRRARIAIKTVFFIVPWGLAMTGYVHWLLGSVMTTLAILTTTLLVAAAPFVLRRTSNLNLTSLFILTPLYVAYSGWSLGTGGVLAPGTSFLLLLPLLAMIFRGFRMAMIWLVLVVVTWLAIFGAGAMGYIATVDVTEAGMAVRRMIELLVLGTTVFGFFYLKDNLQQWLIDALRKKEAETRAVVETAPDGILTVDLDGTVLSANDAASRIFARSSQELLDCDVRELVKTLDTKHLRANTDSMTEFGVTEEHCGQRKDDEFPLEVAFGLLDDQERPQIVLVLRDITERKKAEQQLLEARDDALEASQAKSVFLANMSHELRTPLNAVIGYSEMITEEIEEIREQDESGAEVAVQFVPDLHRIQSAGHHLLALINDILDLSKIEAGKMTTHVEAIDIRELIEDITTTIGPLIKKNNNTIETNIDEELTHMHSDATKVRQILFNLLSNASKFGQNGHICLEATTDDQSDQIVIIVEDEGIGMSQEQIDEVFEAFSQADESTTREFGGTGLGLTITHHFSDLLGGDIDVKSSPGEGTTFTVRLASDLRKAKATTS